MLRHGRSRYVQRALRHGSHWRRGQQRMYHRPIVFHLQSIDRREDKANGRVVGTAVPWGIAGLYWQPQFCGGAVRAYTKSGFVMEQAQTQTGAQVTPTPPIMNSKKVGDNKVGASLTSMPSSGSPGVKKAVRRSTSSVSGLSKPQQEKRDYVRIVGGKLFEWTKLTLSITWQFIRNPLIVKKWSRNAWTSVKDMAAHTWAGFKLLGVEIRTSKNLVAKRIGGNPLTRRERRQLVRTTADLARVVPFMFFILVPFMELLLPVALKLFPNMLPSTFQDSYKREEDMKRQLKLRLELASFLQEMVVEMEDKVKEIAMDKAEDMEKMKISLDDVQHFMELVRMGKPIHQESVIKVAKLFSDELTTDNMSRSQLVTLCRYMGLTPYGGDQFLRFQLRSKITTLREDDATIFFEGVESLNLLELKQACEERGMRATGLTMHQLRTQLRRWIDLSVDKNVPLSLLILSRAFTLQGKERRENIESALSEAISQMDEDVLHEALVAGAKSQDLETDPATLSKLKLEAIMAQNELIEAEIKEKARKQEFLEKLRMKAQQELDEQLGVAEVVSEAVDQREKEATEQMERVEEGSSIDKEIVLEEPTPDIAKPIKLEETAHVEAQVTEAKENLEKTLEFLQVLASDSSLEEEKKNLEKILEKQEELDAEKAVSSGRIIKTDDEGTPVSVAAEGFEPEKRIRSLLKRKVKSMLDKLEVDVEKTDEEIGNNLKILDLDNDGKISAHELRLAIVKALKQKEDYSDDKINELIEQLDLDRDGIISLDELDSILRNVRDERLPSSSL